MNVRYVSQGVEWTEAMKAYVRQQIVTSMIERLKTENFEMSVHLHPRDQFLEMWAVLQTFDGHNNEVVRQQGGDFYTLTRAVAQLLRIRVQKSRNRRRPNINPFQFLFTERTA